ncbi:MAG: carbamoyltransferase C-terminal domain-containing protein [Candidatus Omnitrophota bacterium]
MYILGICDSQDSGAVLVEDQNNINDLTESITAVNEERITRTKLKGGFPLFSIKEVMRIRNVKSGDIKLVVVASHMTPVSILRKFNKYHEKIRNKNSQFSFLLSLYIGYQVFAKKIKFMEKLEAYFSKLIIKSKLKKIGIKAQLLTVEHHQAHAYGAYATSGFNKALIFTIDGLGDGVSFTVNIGEQGKVKRIFEQDAQNDITLYYSRLTEKLGFIPIQDEGKVMGLAAYSQCYTENAKNSENSKYLKPGILLRTEAGSFRKRNYLFSLFRDRDYYGQIKSNRNVETAAAFQEHLEKKITEVVNHWIKKTGIKDIVLSGGFFANIKVNQKICQLDTVNDVYIFPHMGDGGLALGAVYVVKKIKPFKIKNIFWGNDFNQDEIKLVLEENKVNYQFFNNIEEQIAKFLSQGAIVARFNGPMEFGPRALGNRSIIAQATDKSIQLFLNQKLARDAFMPFAPAILATDREKCCLMPHKAGYTALFMNMGFNATEYLKKTCPAVVHEDGSIRPQFVTEQSNASFYKILDAYKRITQIPVLLNTSFNVHEEPIVCTPLDALKSFKKVSLDYLAIGNFLIKGENNEKNR